MRIPTRLVITIALMALIGGAAQAAFFPLGVWYEGGVGEFRNNLIPEDPAVAAAMYKRDFADMAAHGVNAAVVPNTQPKHHKVLLDGAQVAGVKLIVELDRLGSDIGQMTRGAVPLTPEGITKDLDLKLKPIASHPALLGVQILDEPPADTFDRYSKIHAALKAYAPKLIPFTCLIGASGVEAFSKAVSPAAAAFDFYPIGERNPVGDTGPILAFDRMAREAVQAGLSTHTPVWSVIQAHSVTGYNRVPAPSELRCMTYLALANGCKGIWWFLYQTELPKPGSGELEMKGLVDPSFKPNPTWDEVGQLTKSIRKLIPTLQTLSPGDDSMVSSQSVSHVLKDQLGHVYVFTVNTDTLFERHMEIKLNWSSTKGDPQIVRVGEWKRIVKETAGGKLIWTEKLSPGDGALYRVQ